MTPDKHSSWKIHSNNSNNILAEHSTSRGSPNTTPLKVLSQSNHGNSLDRKQHTFMPCLSCQPLPKALRGRVSTLHHCKSSVQCLNL